MNLLSPRWRVVALVSKTLLSPKWVMSKNSKTHMFQGIGITLYNPNFGRIVQIESYKEPSTWGPCKLMRVEIGNNDLILIFGGIQGWVLLRLFKRRIKKNVKMERRQALAGEAAKIKSLLEKVPMWEFQAAVADESK